MKPRRGMSKVEGKTGSEWSRVCGRKERWGRKNWETENEFYAVFYKSPLCLDWSFSNPHSFCEVLNFFTTKKAVLPEDKTFQSLRWETKCWSITAGEMKHSFGLKWNEEEKNQLWGNVSNADRPFWAKAGSAQNRNRLRKSLPQATLCVFLCCLFSLTDLSCYTLLVNLPRSCFTLCFSSLIFINKLFRSTCTCSQNYSSCSGPTRLMLLIQISDFVILMIAT